MSANMNRRLWRGRGRETMSSHQRRRAAVSLGAAALLAAIAGCGSSNQPTGSLYVKVVDKSNAPAADVVVTTQPESESQATDALGSVFFARLAAGNYAVTGTHPIAGSGRTTVHVAAGEVAEATIVLGGSATGRGGAGGRGGGGGGGAGSGGSVSTTGGSGGSAAGTGGGPAGSGGSAGGSGGTGGTGGSGGGGSGGIAGMGARGGTGGTAGTGAAGTGGVAGRGGTGGTGGVAGTGGTGGTGGGAVATLVLAALTKDSNGVDLTWTPTPGNAFATYRIYRGSSASALAVINILQDGTALQYRDESGQLGVAYTYRVGGVTAGGQEVQSNTQTITTGVYIDVGSQIEKMMVDPTRPYLYGVDRVNNTLHFIDLTTNKVEKSIFVGSSPVDLDINIQGTTLYVANFGSTEIAKVDLATRTLTGSIFVDTTIGTWDGNPYRLACTAGDTLVFTSQDQWNDLKLVNALTGASLNVAGSIYSPDLAASPDGISVYAGESGISTQVLYRYDVVNGKLMSADQSAGVSGFVGGTVLTSRDGKHIFYAGMKILAKNLKSVLGTFSEVILAINSDGSVAIGSTKIFDGTTFAVKRATPLSTTKMAVSPDDKTLYLYDTTSSRIYLFKL